MGTVLVHVGVLPYFYCPRTLLLCWGTNMCILHVRQNDSQVSCTVRLTVNNVYILKIIHVTCLLQCLPNAACRLEKSTRAWHVPGTCLARNVHQIFEVKFKNE